MKRELVLASSSPRRQQLLSAAGISFRVQAANVPEEIKLGESPRQFSERLAHEKAEAIAKLLPASFVLGADTIVVVDEQVLGKPVDADDARRMLRLLSGRRHQVLTSVCLLGDGVRDVRTELTEVHFVEVTDREIAEYITTGEPMDKAGAYGIQGIASRWIPRIEGCYFNVVGLPVALVYQMLKRAGVVTNV